jgi:hypothetical protein
LKSLPVFFNKCSFSGIRIAELNVCKPFGGTSFLVERDMDLGRNLVSFVRSKVVNFRKDVFDEFSDTTSIY